MLPTLVVAVLATVAPALAAEEPPRLTVQGTLINRADDNKPVEGVTFTVTSTSGKTYEGQTDENGRYRIEVPANDTGDLTIALDEATLPEGAELAKGQATEREISKNNTTTLVSFSPAVGEDTRDVTTKWDRLPGLVYNGLLFGLVLALAALGLSMIFGTTGLTNFAHGELVTFGALMAYAFNVSFGWPFVPAAAMAVVLGALFGWLQDTALWRPLRKRGTGLIAMMIVSIGLQFLLRNVFQYGTQGRTLNYQTTTFTGSDLLGITWSWLDVMIGGVSLLVVLGATFALKVTRLGRATRAVSDNPALAASTGINVNRVINVVWIMGTALAALSGVFLAFTTSVTFQIGQLTLLLIFAAVCVGGLGSVWGAFIGSLIIGVLIETSVLIIPSELKNAGALVLLILILLIRPQGLLGRKERLG
jgi:branched-chain amino acid transport system permease protein